MEVWLLGPEISEGRGGMAGVIGTMAAFGAVTGGSGETYRLVSYGTFCEGQVWRRYLYERRQFHRFCRLPLSALPPVFHVHMASRRSALRKAQYMRYIRTQVAPRQTARMVLQIHSGVFLDFYAGLPAGQQALIREAVESADVVVALSEMWRRRLTETFHIKTCVVIPNGVDTAALSAARTDAAARRHRFLFLGRLEQAKGVYDLVDAAALAAKQDPALVCGLGGLGERGKLEAYIREKGAEGHVQLLGWLDQAARLTALADAGTVVLPSYGEAFPLTLLEGMAAGKGIVSTAVGGIPEIIRAQGAAGENGILVRPGDVRALAEALLSLSLHGDRLAAMGARNAREAEQKYSLDAQRRRLSACYDLAVGARQPQ